MKNKTDTIRKLVLYLNNIEYEGGFWLPNIQRAFVWSEEQITRLFDSIMRQYPISTLLVWKTKAPIHMRRFIADFNDNMKLSEYHVPENKNKKMLVLDGQQRLQSLLIGLSGSYNGRKLCLNVLSGEKKASEDIRFSFRFISEEHISFPWVKMNELVFNKYDEGPKIRRNLNKQNYPMSKEQEELYEDNVNKVLITFCTNQVVTYQELDSIDKPEAYTETDVVEIFIRANSGGTLLGKSDLLFSLLTSSWEEADQQMDDVLEILNISGYQFTRDFILKTCLSLLNKGATYEVSKFRNKQTKDAIIDGWDQIVEAINDVKEFVYHHTFLRNDTSMPSYLTLIPLIYFRYHFRRQWKKSRGLERYILHTLIAGAFSGSPDGLIDKLISNIRETGEFNTQTMFKLIGSSNRSIELSQDKLLGVRFKSPQMYVLFNLWHQHDSDVPIFDNEVARISPIFSENELLKIKEFNAKTGRHNLLRYKARERNQLANCIMLSATENPRGNGEEMVKTESWLADKNDSFLERHLIPKNPDLWQIENFDDFIKERKALILKKFNFMLQGEE